MNDKETLISWLNLFSLKKDKEYKLSSGQISDIYVDVKKTAFHNRCNKLLAKMLFEKMTSTFHCVEAVAGVALGGCHLASIVSIQHPLNIDVIYVRKSPKEHGSQNLVECPNVTLGQRIVLFEDVVTTGDSAIKAAQTLENMKLDCIGILSVVDRRINKTPYLGVYKFASLVNFEELTY